MGRCLRIGISCAFHIGKGEAKVEVEATVLLMNPTPFRHDVIGTCNASLSSAPSRLTFRYLHAPLLARSFVIGSDTLRLPAYVVAARQNPHLDRLKQKVSTSYTVFCSTKSPQVTRYVNLHITGSASSHANTILKHRKQHIPSTWAR